MWIISANKIKIIAVIVGGIAIALGIGIPYLTSYNNAKEIHIPPEQSQPLPNPESIIKTPPSKPKPKQATIKTFTSEVEGLKNEKSQFLTSVENSTASYKSAIGNISNIKQLEDGLRQCISRPEVNTNITDDEQKKLKEGYTTVKADIQAFENIRTQINAGDLKKMEQEAEKRNEDEEKYNSFKNKLEEVKKKYQAILNKKSDSNFSSLLSGIKLKLNLADKQCSLRDLIKINDALGQKNNNQ